MRDVHLIIGRRKGKRTTSVQSLAFPAAQWTPRAARAWLRAHGFKANAPDPHVGRGKRARYRFRQLHPDLFQAGRFRTVVVASEKAEAVNMASNPKRKRRRVKRRRPTKRVRSRRRRAAKRNTRRSRLKSHAKRLARRKRKVRRKVIAASSLRYTVAMPRRYWILFLRSYPRSGMRRALRKMLTAHGSSGLYFLKHQDWLSSGPVTARENAAGVLARIAYIAGKARRRLRVFEPRVIAVRRFPILPRSATFAS